MPWCEACARYLTPTTLGERGDCPSCGAVIAEPKTHPRAPWHFKLLVGAASVYLGWRLIQGIGWVVDALV